MFERKNNAAISVAIEDRRERLQQIHASLMRI